MGETLAKAELLITTAMILGQIKLSLPKHHPNPDTEDAVAGLARTPNPFYVHIETRL